MSIYHCTASEWRNIHIQVEAETKQEAAKKAMKLFKEHGSLVLFRSVEGMWAGPEEPVVGEEIEVTQALDNGPPYWGETEFIRIDNH